MLAFSSAFLAFGSTIEINQATCPCLTESPVSEQYHENGMLVNREGPTGEEQFSLTYGVGCAKHNEMEAACVVANPPDWCGSRWCWVDANNCNDPAIPGVIASGGGSYFPDPVGAPISVYSYSTCGDADAWTDSNEDPTQS